MVVNKAVAALAAIVLVQTGVLVDSRFKHEQMTRDLEQMSVLLARVQVQLVQAQAERPPVEPLPDLGPPASIRNPQFQAGRY